MVVDKLNVLMREIASLISTYEGALEELEELKPSFVFETLNTVESGTIKIELGEKYPNARLYIADMVYCYPTYTELVEWLNVDSLDKMVWLEDIWDCDNFAVESYCRIHRVVGNIAYGEAWGYTPIGYHAFCIAWTDRGLSIIEPQNDDTRDWKSSDYVPNFIKM